MSKFIMQNVTVDYPHFITPYKLDGMDEAKFGCVVLIPKEDEQVGRLNTLLRRIAQEAMGDKWGNVKPPADRMNPLKDGDKPKGNGEPYPEAYKGNFVLNCSSIKAPGVIDEFKNRTSDGSKFRRGCICHLAIEFFAYNKNGNKGISSRLVNVMFVNSGESLGGDLTPEEEFASIPAAPPPRKSLANDFGLGGPANDFGLGDDLPF